MCIECEYVSEVQDVMDKFNNKGTLSNTDMLQRLTAICLKYWKEVADDHEEIIEDETCEKCGSVMEVNGDSWYCDQCGIVIKIDDEFDTTN